MNSLNLSRTAKIWIGVAVFVLIAGGWFMSSYNGFVGLEEQVKTEQSQVETQLQRRFDLIPNLVESVKGVLKQEQDVFGKIADARTRYAGATAGSDAKLAAAGEVESSLSRLMVIVENYPTLKSADTVQSLMSQLEGSENRVSVARQRFNEAVNGYNVAIRRFPANVIAGMFGFQSRQRFEAAQEAQAAPKVDLKLK